MVLYQKTFGRALSTVRGRRSDNACQAWLIRNSSFPIAITQLWGSRRHIPSDLVVTRRFSHHTLALAMGYPHHVSSAPTAICMEMRHGPDRQSDTQKPHDHR